MRRFAKNNPIRYTYNNLKTNAKRRRKEFSITFEQFKEWAIETEYMLGKGRSRNSFGIDRIIEELGYHIDNIQKLPNHENVKKYLKYSHDEKGKPVDFKMQEHSESEKQDDVPF